MMDLQAAIGIHQLARVEANWTRRLAIWERYNAAFTSLPVVLPVPAEPDTRHGLHLYTLLLELDALRITRDQFMEAMTAVNIGVGVHYLPVHTHPYYAQTLSHRPEDFPNALWIGERTASLPLSAALSDDDVDDVIEAVVRTLRMNAR
jgi:dTDP-4-amino-4,6-dideoxygalactose transaminase